MIAKSFGDENEVPDGYTGLVYLYSGKYEYKDSFWIYENGVAQKTNQPVIVKIGHYLYYYIECKETNKNLFWSHPLVVQNTLKKILGTKK